MSSRELYDRLGINKTASSAEIRSSYKTLVLKHHPDKNPNGDSSKFQGIQEAYEVLSDETKRSTYDATGKIPGRRDSERPSAATGFKSGESADFFEQMFGGGAASSGPGRGPGSFRPSAPPRRRKAKQQTVPLDVSLEDLFLQKTFNFSVKRMILCKSCKGSGAKPSATQKQCYTCQGYGQTRSQTAVSSSILRSQWNECQTCRGTGKRYSSADKCLKCEGECMMKTHKHLTVQLQPGHTDGSHILMEEAGDEEVGADKAGDLLFIVAVQPHPTFRILPDARYDLECDATLTLSELLLGFNRIVTVHLDGRHLEVSHSETIEPGSSSRILLKGEGLWMGRPSMPTRSSSSSSSANGLNASSKGKRGDLWIHVKAAGSLSQWIKGLSEEQRAQFESMLPPRRPALSAEKGETTRFPEAVILSAEDAQKYQEQKPTPTGQSQNYTRGPNGYEPTDTPDLNCKPS